jgi:glutamate synthase (NADPH/NADH) large chain
MKVKTIRGDFLPDAPYGPESDACAIYLGVRKQGQSTFGTLKRSLSALTAMGHRTGFVNGEGDGAGVQTDIPRRLWSRKLSQASLRASLAVLPGFWVGHLFVPSHTDSPDLHNEIYTAFEQAGLNLIYQQTGRTRHEVLGGNARLSPPVFWQIAGHDEFPDLEKRLLEIQVNLEKQFPIHFLSLSPHVVVYKMRGSVEALARYYLDLQDHNYDTSVVLCHARYSTNTVSSFERAQPFALLGHNGEINTISRLRVEAEQIGAVLPPEGSDSQDLDRTLHTLCANYGLDLIEAMETIFPPVPFELDQLPAEQRAVYTRIRQSFGPYAQGPAAIVARYGDMIAGSVDAVGLRPLWFVETEKEYIFSSERGAIPLEVMVDHPRPLGPGEKLAVRVRRGENAELFDHSRIRQHVMNRAFQREAPQLARLYWTSWDHAGQENPHSHNLATASKISQNESEAVILPKPRKTRSRKTAKLSLPWQKPEQTCSIDLNVLAANGWNRENLQAIHDELIGHKEIGSLGYDGPLAVLAKHRVNVADFFKETVAVVTNPAIDHGREAEVFSTSSLLGACPAIGQAPNPHDILVTLRVPLLTGGHPSLGAPEATQALAEEFGTLSIESLLETFKEHTSWLVLGVYPEENVDSALERLAVQSARAVASGTQCLVLDDSETLVNGLGWLDPMLAVSRIDESLRQACLNDLDLRRRSGLVVRSAAIRSLHDIVLLSGFGADAINAYALSIAAVQTAEKAGIPALDIQRQQLKSLKEGLEKVISTMGCHELRGYGRVCSSIGLAPSVAAVLQTPNYFGSETAGLNWERLDRESVERGQELRTQPTVHSLPQVEHFFPRFWKKASQFSRSEAGYDEVMATFTQLKQDSPISLRHIVDFKKVRGTVLPSQVDLSVKDYRLPFVISAMSFGSQGETSFRAYLETAVRMNIISINGEGGELPELMGLQRKNRGQQVASGRFGVNAQFLNSAAVLEIKIGQGAKPGEGGMLPAYKVTPKVAEARRTPPFVPLMSPSNNHDLYSIEDLAQLIEELKVVNPQAKVSVKCPVVPNIGVIAVGIAKAGADIINLSGFDGGTGAARKHSLQYVGLPAEIGVIQSHRALVEAGLRHKVEIWCDGGMKTGEDAVKMILLGANRIGFGTMAMVAIGCSICRKCQEGTCFVGITTQIESIEEALDKGLRVFTPLEYEASVSHLTRYFLGLEEEIRQITARLGATRLQDLVGRGDLLEQISCQDKVDLSPMFEAIPVRSKPELESGVGRLLVRPRNNLTRLLGDLIMETVLDDQEREITYQDSVTAIDRALGSHVVGALLRRPDFLSEIDHLHLRFGPSSIAGNGFAAWTADPLDIIIEGGAQDGTAKGSCSGRIAVMKGINHEGLRIDGSVGKSFAYGAQGGTLIVQGNADSRACIRLSGADVIFGSEILNPIQEESLCTSTHANLKGYACEYMTAGRVVILGDPGPYAFSGMTGGVVYQKLTHEMGFDKNALQRRIALGAQVKIEAVNAEDMVEIQQLLNRYIDALEQTYQYETAEHIRALSSDNILRDQFVKIVSMVASNTPALVEMMVEDLSE